jgi:hypothetical protein
MNPHRPVIKIESFASVLLTAPYFNLQFGISELENV